MQPCELAWCAVAPVKKLDYWFFRRRCEPSALAAARNMMQGESAEPACLCLLPVHSPSVRARCAAVHATTCSACCASDAHATPAIATVALSRRGFCACCPAVTTELSDKDCVGQMTDQCVESASSAWLMPHLRSSGLAVRVPTAPGDHLCVGPFRSLSRAHVHPPVALTAARTTHDTHPL